MVVGKWATFRVPADEWLLYVFGQSVESQNSNRDAEVALCCEYTLAKTDLWAGTSRDLCYYGAFPNNQATKGDSTWSKPPNGNKLGSQDIRRELFEERQ